MAVWIPTYATLGMFEKLFPGMASGTKVHSVPPGPGRLHAREHLDVVDRCSRRGASSMPRYRVSQWTPSTFSFFLRRRSPFGDFT